MIIVDGSMGTLDVKFCHLDVDLVDMAVNIILQHYLLYTGQCSHYSTLLSLFSSSDISGRSSGVRFPLSIQIRDRSVLCSTSKLKMGPVFIAINPI